MIREGRKVNMSKKHIAPKLPVPGVPAAKPATRTIAFRVTAEEWRVLEELSQLGYQGLVTPTLLVSDFFRRALKDGRFAYSAMP